MTVDQGPLVMMVVARLGISGISTNLVQLGSALQRAGARVVIVHGSPDAGEGDVHDLADRAGLGRHLVPVMGRAISPLRDLRALWEIWRLMRRLRPDVVHTHASKGGLLGRAAALLAGVRVRVHTFHGHVLTGYFGPRTSHAYVLLERMAARVSTRIVTLSETLATELADEHRVAPRSRFEVIPLGLQLEGSSEAARHRGPLRPKLSLEAGQPLVGALGRLVPVKNLGLFVAAAGRVHALRPEVRFAIVGDGESRGEVAAAIEAAGLGGVVHLTGWERDVAGVMSDLDLLAVTSHNEGTPVSLLEAIAAGVPVVATDVGGVGDVLRPELASQIVPPGDEAALAATMLRSLDAPPDLSAARARILAVHDIDAAAARHLDLYRRLLAGRSRRTVHSARRAGR